MCWSDNSDTFARRSWDEFRQLQVSNTGIIFQWVSSPVQSPIDTQSGALFLPVGALLGTLLSLGDSLHFQSLTHASPHQKTLKKTFPVEAGLLRRSERVLPKLPGQACRGHGMVRQVWVNGVPQCVLVNLGRCSIADTSGAYWPGPGTFAAAGHLCTGIASNLRAHIEELGTQWLLCT